MGDPTPSYQETSSHPSQHNYQSPPVGAYQGPPAGAYKGPPAGAYQGPPAGECPSCRNGVLKDDFTCLGVLFAIIFFPIGFLCCCAMKQRRCRNCGAVSG